MEDVVGVAVEIALQNLLVIAEEKIGMVRNFKKDLDKLRKSFLMVSDFLHDAETRQVGDMAVKRWLRSLEDLAFEADNVFDEINYQLLSKKVETTGKKMKNKVQSFVFYKNNPISYRLKLGPRIRGIHEELKVIKQEANDFGLQTRIRDAPDPGPSSSSSSSSGSYAYASMETDSFSVDPIFCGRENDVSIIVDTLISTSPTERVLSVLPIVGMGGLGKTTLARKVFVDQQILSRFGENRIWVHVPRKFDVVVLLRNIVTSMTTENAEHGNREALLKMLQNTLGAKRYLLVLDDIWNDENGMWDDFVNSLSGISSATGNCMIVTTRSREVASIVRTLDVHELKILSKDDCWSIIKAKAVRARDDQIDEFDTVGINIAERCQGLPLAAYVVGGLLCNKSKDEWLSLLSDFGYVNPISKILKLSFDNLSLPSLKKCFAYCSIFPKGYKINKEQLMELWMAEGFLQADQENSSMETRGGKFFYFLLQNSLLQISKRDSYGYATHCSMHDLVHDLACAILEGESNNDDICRNRYIGYSSSGSLSIPKEHTRYLRTLFFNGKISDIMFSDFKSLHALTLVGEDIDDLPTSIRDLIHLRYLDTSKTKIRYLPDSVGKLYHLQTLRAKRDGVREKSYLEKLPDSMKYSISLRHLHIPYNTVLPSEIGRLTSLQTLPYFSVRNENGCRISELGSLKKLKGRLEIRNLEKVRDKNEAMSADLFHKSGIYELILVWNEADREDKENDESVLQGLQPHPNIKSLEICGFNGKNLPLWISKMAVQDKGFNNLTEIKLSDCRECEELPMVGHLPHLKYLYLSNLKNVRSIGSSFYNTDNCSSKSSSSNNGDCKSDIIVVFPTLEKLELSNMPNLIEWAEVRFPASEGVQTQQDQVLVFPHLEYLSVYKCGKLRSAPSHFPSLQKLIIHGMGSSLPLENICGLKLSTLTFLRIRGVKGLRFLPHGLFYNNHNLSTLEISNCRNMRELPYGLHSLDTLATLSIFKCPNLKLIAAYPSQESKMEGFTSLRRLKVRNCKGLTHLPIKMVESCTPSLETLSLCGLVSLKNFHMVVGCLHKMPHLTSLAVKDFPRWSTKDIGSLRNRNLGRLKISPSTSTLSDSSSWDNASFNESVNAMLQPSKISLRKLELHGMEHWDCLPDQIQHLASLSHLWLHDYGIEALPEWFGNLSCLRLLRLNKCKRLRYMTSKEAMQRLTKLTDLQIDGCPLLLKERRSNELPEIDDSEWPKISHIPNIRVDKYSISASFHGH